MDAQEGFAARPGAEFGAYQLLKPVGRSGQSEVWLAKQIADGREVIAKFYWPGISPNRDVVEKLCKLRHKHIVELIDFGEHGGQYYEIQECIVHGSLAEIIIKNGRLPEPRVFEILKQLSAALDYLHKAGVLHRDLKPSNVLLHSLEPFLLKLADFGISRLSESPQVTFGGTFAYLAPELPNRAEQYQLTSPTKKPSKKPSLKAQEGRSMERWQMSRVQGANGAGW